MWLKAPNENSNPWILNWFSITPIKNLSGVKKKTEDVAYSSTYVRLRIFSGFLNQNIGQEK
jgi:hypothetical protein